MTPRLLMNVTPHKAKDWTELIPCAICGQESHFVLDFYYEEPNHPTVDVIHYVCHRHFKEAVRKLLVWRKIIAPEDPEVTP